MLTRTIALCLLLWGAAFSASAQDPADRILAGKNLRYVKRGLSIGVVKLDSTELTNQIKSGAIAALLIPHQKGAEPLVVRRCFETKTVFDAPDLTISANDYRALRELATDKIFEFPDAAEKALAGSEASLRTEIESYLASFGGPARELRQLWLGAVLADYPESGAFAAHVTAYRSFVETRTRATLSDIGDLLAKGTPYFVGSDQVLAKDLARINPSEVRELQVGDDVYRATWVGPNFVITPQSEGETSPQALVDRTGLGLAREWAAELPAPFDSTSSELGMVRSVSVGYGPDGV